MPGRFKNIIFDFGGVILHIDYNRTIEAFQRIGIKNFEAHYSKLKQDHLFDEFEKGLIPAAEFYARIRSGSHADITDEQIRDAWNAMLIDFPEETVEWLDSIRHNYNIFLLSNTNEIHEHAFNALIHEKFGEDVLRVFHKVYLSHHLRMRKPDLEIFEHVLHDSHLLPQETLFVDDSFQHIEGAQKAGLQTFYFEKGMSLQDILQ